MKRILTLILGILLALGGLASLGLGIFVAFGDSARAGRLLTGAVLIPLGVMLLELGVALGWFAARRSGGHPATLPPWWASALAFGAAVGGGYLAFDKDYLLWLFFPLGTLAVFAPIAAAGRLGLPRRGARPGWGRLLSAFSWGALVAPALAIGAQIVAVIGAVVAALVGVVIGGQTEFQRAIDTWTYRLQGRDLTDGQASALISFALRQPLVLALGATILVFVAPATEELCKFGGAYFFARRGPRPDGTPTDSAGTIFLLGLASGLGFAATENIFYVAQGVQSDERGWAVAALTRAATPLMHGTATALFALGLARQLERPRGWALLWGALGALGLHAAWNLCGGLVSIASAVRESPGAGASATTLLILSAAVLGLLLIVAIVTLLRQRRALASDPPAAAVPPPPATIPATMPAPPSTVS